MHPVAILSAMDQEISMVEHRLTRVETLEFLGQRFRTGVIAGVDVVTATTGFGKVAAAATTASVLHRFEPRSILFGGVAGGIAPQAHIGDVVVADRLVQHDYDASPIFDPFVIPSLGVAEIATDPDLTTNLVGAVSRYLQSRARYELTAMPDRVLEAADMKLHRGLIASGDRFIGDPAHAADLRRRLPGVLAVEMEGAAVAQVCAERSVPLAVFRLISDRADNEAPTDFLAFVSSVSAPFAAGIVEEYLSDLE
jgi:adenosylhomocysteine nucleosidase